MFTKSLQVGFIGLVFCVATAWAGPSAIQGVVKDQSGAMVPDAKVLVVQTETNSTFDLRTNNEGAYVAPNLPAAIYRVANGALKLRPPP